MSDHDDPLDGDGDIIEADYTFEPEPCECGIDPHEPAFLHADDCIHGYGGCADLDADRDINPVNEVDEPPPAETDADKLLGLELAAHNWRVDALEHRGSIEGTVAALAVLVSELAVARRVVPRMIGGTFIEIGPTPTSSRRVGASVLSIEHPPIVVACEYGCETIERALEIGQHALKASTWSIGWAPRFIDLLRPYCRIRAVG
jgi:hypothetical protein